MRKIYVIISVKISWQITDQKVKSFASYFKVSKDEILSKIRKNMQFYLLFQFVDVRNFVLIAVSYKLM